MINMVNDGENSGLMWYDGFNSGLRGFNPTNNN